MLRRNNFNSNINILLEIKCITEPSPKDPQIRLDSELNFHIDQMQFYYEMYVSLPGQQDQSLPQELRNLFGKQKRDTNEDVS